MKDLFNLLFPVAILYFGTFIWLDIEKTHRKSDKRSFRVAGICARVIYRAMALGTLASVVLWFVEVL